MCIEDEAMCREEGTVMRHTHEHLIKQGGVIHWQYIVYLLFVLRMFWLLLKGMCYCLME